MIVLLLAVAASITFVIARQSLLSARTTADRVAAADAEDAARATLVRLTGTLEAEPLTFTENVLDGEPPRQCLQGEQADELIPPGDPWPNDCGLVWAYEAPEPGWTGVRLELTPPHPDNPALTAVARVAIGRIEVALAGRYLPQGAGRFTWFGDETLDLSTLNGSDSVLVNGSIYNDTVTGTNPTAPGLTLTGTVAAETLTQPPADLPGVTWLSATPNPAGTPPVGDVRERFIASSAGAMLATTTSLLQDIGCRGGPAANLPEGSTNLCLAEGRTVITHDNQPVEVPAGGELLLAPNGNRLLVWHSPDTTDLAAESGLLCANLPGCDLAQHAQDLIAQAQHPASTNYWENGGATLLGDFVLPTTGIVVTDRATHLGVCAPDSNQSGNLASGCPDTTFAKSVTFVAPTVIVGGPLRATAPAQLGIAAQNTIVIPYWARPPAQDATPIDAHLLTGPGPNTGLAAFPAENIGAGNTAPQLTVRGSVNGSKGTLGLPGFTQVSLLPSQGNSTPPWFSPAGLAWSLVEIFRTSPET